MDPTALLVEYSPWLLILYIFLKDVFPKVFPEVTKVLSKHISTEDRLFTLLESNATVLLKLNQSLIELCDTLKELHHRVLLIEENMSDNSSALRIASRLIKD